MPRGAKLQLEEFLVIRILMFFFGSFLLLALSWRSLRNIRSHGFYRFFAFEIILILLLVNATFWFQSPHAVLQLISWFLLLLSIIFVSHGFYLLKKTGGLVKERAMHPENLNFENTTNDAYLSNENLKNSDSKQEVLNSFLKLFCILSKKES